MVKDFLLRKTSESGDLPALPEILIRLDQQLRDPESKIEDIAGLIETEPVLTGKVLSLSRSAMFGGRSEIRTLPAAIMRIGLVEIRKIVYSFELTRLFDDNRLFDQYEFWRHSLTVALYTRELAKRSGASPRDLNDSYLAGLMHDVGLMVFAYTIPEEYLEFLRRARDVEKPLHIQETEEFGIDHGELGGAFMLRWWPIDPQIIDTVRYHHYPFMIDPNERTITHLVHVANSMCENQGINSGIDVYVAPFEEGAWENLRLSLDEVREMLEEVRMSIARTEELLTLGDS